MRNGTDRIPAAGHGPDGPGGHAESETPHDLPEKLGEFGGVVRPITARALTIPVTAEAKGKTAYEFERPDRPLFVVSEKTGDPGTIGVLGYAKKTRKENVSAFHPLFVLRKYAKMKPDPWFPTKNRIEFFASREAKLLFHREEKNWNTRRT